MVKGHSCSFTFAFIYAVCKCANEIAEFRYRFLDDEGVLYDTIHTSFTYPDANSSIVIKKAGKMPLKREMGYAGENRKASVGEG